MPAIEAKGKYPVTFSIDKVNGEANSETATANSSMAIYNKLPKHRPVMEEFTGTWCQNCPRGWIALEVMARLHPDFIGLSYHSGDVMQVIDQKLFLGFDTENPSYPMANIDRVYTDIDPYYGADMTPFGIEKLWKKQAEILAPASWETEAAFTPDGKNIKAKAILEFPEAANDADKYSVEFVLVTDGLHGEGQAWEQENTLDQGAKDEFPFPEAEPFLQGKSSVSNIHYNDVVVATTRLLNGLIKLPAKVEEEKAFSIEGEIANVDSIKN